jgi:hypothetical protein
MIGGRSGSGTRLFPKALGALTEPSGRQEHPLPKVQRGSHAGACAIGPHIVVDLREGREHAFHQLAGGRVVSRSP